MTAAAPPVSLVEFLERRYAERQAIAEAAPEGPWHSVLETGDDAENFGSVYFGGPSWADAKCLADWYEPGAGEHIERHDPAYVLADLASKRAILDFVQRVQASAGEPPYWCTEDAGALIHIVRLLAAPFLDHPEYQKEWDT